MENILKYKTRVLVDSDERRQNDTDVWNIKTFALRHFNVIWLRMFVL